MKLKYLSFLIILIVFFNCKNESKTTDTAISNNSAQTTPTQQAANDQLKQVKPLTAHAIYFFTTDLWHYDAALVIKDPEKSKSYNGKWIKLKPDNTLETAYYDNEPIQGSWAINEADNVITIVENGAHPTYSEWEIKTSSSSDNIMIWVGTPRFGLNNTQIKMTRHTRKPLRKD